MSEPLDPTQALPIQDTEPSPPKPTLASLIVEKMEGLQLSNAAVHDRVNDLYVQSIVTLTQSRFLLLAAIGLFAFVALEGLAVLTLVAWLVGHGR